MASMGIGLIMGPIGIILQPIGFIIWVLGMAKAYKQ